jgi:hypothetical protein
VKSIGWNVGAWKRIDLMIEPRDLWVGVYWTWDGAIFRAYVCLVPVLVVRLSYLPRRYR